MLESFSSSRGANNNNNNNNNNNHSSGSCSSQSTQLIPHTANKSGGGGSGGSGGGSVHSAGGGRRPVKIWNAGRTVRKALVVSTYDEFHRKGREKLGLGKVEPIRVVLESDGTQVRTYMSHI